MQVHVQGGERALALGMRSYLDRRLRWSLGRYAGCVAQVTVRVLENDGATGRVGRGCRVSAELLSSGRLIQHEAENGCLFTAIDAAMERTGRSIRRQVEQGAERPVRR